MNKKILITATLLGLISIVLGAFASHGLKNSISEASLRSFEIGVKYQMYHAVFLFFISQFSFLKTKTKKSILILTVLGVILFSLSIYLLSTSLLLGINFKPIGFLTPIGGFLLIFAWVLLLFAIIKEKNILFEK
jgi:uncharacterized membrane protein YgdD (TMEM256/DUF423 family)